MKRNIKYLIYLFSKYTHIDKQILKDAYFKNKHLSFTIYDTSIILLITIYHMDIYSLEDLYDVYKKIMYTYLKRYSKNNIFSKKNYIKLIKNQNNYTFVPTDKDTFNIIVHKCSIYHLCEQLDALECIHIFCQFEQDISQYKQYQYTRLEKYPNNVCHLHFHKEFY